MWRALLQLIDKLWLRIDSIRTLATAVDELAPVITPGPSHPIDPTTGADFTTAASERGGREESRRHQCRFFCHRKSLFENTSRGTFLLPFWPSGHCSPMRQEHAAYGTNEVARYCQRAPAQPNPLSTSATRGCGKPQAQLDTTHLGISLSLSSPLLQKKHRIIPLT
jgi:hypothetical protein